MKLTWREFKKLLANTQNQSFSTGALSEAPGGLVLVSEQITLQVCTVQIHTTFILEVQTIHILINWSIDGTAICNLFFKKCQTFSGSNFFIQYVWKLDILGQTLCSGNSAFFTIFWHCIDNKRLTSQSGSINLAEWELTGGARGRKHYCAYSLGIITRK